MVDSYLSAKFDINSLDGFWENAFYGRRTTTMTDNRRPRHGNTCSSADSQAELKNNNNNKKKVGKNIGDPVGMGCPN